MALSKTQSTRLGVILSVMAGDEVPQKYLHRVMMDGFIAADETGRLALTDKGLDEKNRLCTLAGLNIKYLSERIRDDELTGKRDAVGAAVSKDTVPARI